MPGIDTKSGAEPLVNYKRLRMFVLYPLAAALCLGFLYLWLPPAFTGFSIKRQRSEAIAPLLEKAKQLALKYQNVLAAPGAGEGLPVIWCVQNRGELAVSVDGDSGKPLYVSNYPAMPLYSGSKHQACAPMLLILEKQKPGRPITVFFKEVL